MEWTFQKLSKHCAKCNRGFEEEQPFFSALYLSDELVQRKDFCNPCWNPEEEPKPFSFWKSITPKRNAPKQDNRHNVMQVLEKLLAAVPDAAGNEEPVQDFSEDTRKKLSFLLALTLMRKKMLKLKETCTENNEEVMILEKIADATTLRIPVFNLPEGDLNTLKDDLSRILDM